MASPPSAVLPREHGIDDLHDEALLSARQALDTLHASAQVREEGLVSSPIGTV
jgi:hypothetical protein